MPALRIVTGHLLTLAIIGCAAQSTVRAAADPLPQAPVPSPQPPPQQPIPTQPQTQNADKPVQGAVRQTSLQSLREPFAGVPGGEVAVRIRAQVNGVPIFDEEVREACFQFLRQTMALPEPDRSAKQKEIVEKGLENLIDMEAILQDLDNRMKGEGPRAQFLEKLKQGAKKEFKERERQMKAALAKEGITCHGEDELRRALKDRYGISLDFLRRQSERQFMAMQYMRSRIYTKVDRATGHEHIVEYYNDHGNEFDVPDSVKWQDIFIDASRFRNRQEARRHAEEVAAMFRSGVPIAKILPYDNGDSSYRNGDGFGQRRGEIKPIEAEPALFRLKDGEVGPIIEVPSGFHVIRLVKRTYAGRKPLDEETQKEIRKKIEHEVEDREYKNLLKDIKRQANIEVYPPT